MAPVAAVAEDDSARFLPDWADCIVLRCTRCGQTTKVSWEVFDRVAKMTYEKDDMPERLVWWDCLAGRCRREEAHFVDLLPPSARPHIGPDVAYLRGRRVCGCRECTRW